MIIGIDIDNVLNNLSECVLRVYNEDSGDNLKLEDIDHYYMEDFVKPEFKANFPNYFNDKRVWSQIEVAPGAREAIASFFREEFEIYFITSTTPRNVPKKADWLQRNFPFLDISKCLITTPNKGIVHVDVLIDDYLYNILDSEHYVGIIVDAPWNQCKQEKYNFGKQKNIRCFGWKDIQEKVFEIYRSANTPFCQLCVCKDCRLAERNGGADGCGDCFECSKEQGKWFKDSCPDYDAPQVGSIVSVETINNPTNSKFQACSDNAWNEIMERIRNVTE